MNYTIQSGDTLTSIARRFGTSVQAIAQANGITNPDRIRAGQAIQVPDPPGQNAQPGPAQPQSGVGTYTVRSGDTLSAIAQRQGMSVADLARINGIADPNRISAGQVLNLAGMQPQPSNVPLPRPRPSPMAVGLGQASGQVNRGQDEPPAPAGAPGWRDIASMPQPPAPMQYPQTQHGQGQPGPSPQAAFPADLSTLNNQELALLLSQGATRMIPEQQYMAAQAEFERRRTMAEVTYGAYANQFPPEIQAANRRIGTDLRIAPPAPQVPRSIGEGEYLPGEQRLLMALGGNMRQAPQAVQFIPQLGMLTGGMRTTPRSLGNLTGVGV